MYSGVVLRHHQILFITDYFFTDSATKGCKDCGICILYAANNDFGMWQYAVNNTFLPLKGPMMQRPDIKGKLKLFPAKKTRPLIGLPGWSTN